MQWRPSFALMGLALATGCLGGSGGDHDERHALCAYQARCGFIGASEAAACGKADTYGPSPFLAGPFAERVGYSTDDAVADGRLTVDRDAQSACLAALRSATCGSAAILACIGVYRGAVATGGSCEDDVECVGGMCTTGLLDGDAWSGDAGCEGVCAAHLATGASCADGWLTCAPGDMCDGQTLQCQTRPREGEACTPEGVECVAGFFCDETDACAALRGAGGKCASEVFPNGGCEGSLRCTDHVCAPPGGDGDRCEVPASGGVGGLGVAGGGPCRDGFYCNSGTCRALLSDGAACPSPELCVDGHACAGFAFATPSAGGKVGTCAPWADVGGACVTGATVTGCPADMECDAGVCARRPVPSVALGGACDPAADAPASAQCAVGSCDDVTRVCALVCSED